MIMKKLLLIFFLFALFQQNKYVSLKFKAEKRGTDKAVFFIFLKTMDGIHINSEPKPEIILDDNEVEILNIKFEKTEKNYIDTNKPIKAEIKSKSKNLKLLKGKFICFYCSETEGWCSKLVNNFEIELK